MAECSESTGTISAPYFLVSAITSSPAHTRVSLLAKAMRFFLRMAASVGSSPTLPMTAVTTVSASASYNSNMRQLVYDKLKSCELVVFNRFNGTMDKMEYHKIVRAVSRRCDIAYEYVGGKVEYDDIQDPLPFDLNAPIVEIGDDDYAEWYRDMSEEPKKYEGKTVKFLAQVCQTNRAGKNSFVPGRFAMTCCVQDIQFVGFPCSYDGYKALEQRAWVTVTAKVNYKFHNIYRGKGPVLTAISVEPAEKPLNDVVTFS